MARRDAPSFMVAEDSRTAGEEGPDSMESIAEGATESSIGIPESIGEERDSAGMW